MVESVRLFTLRLPTAPETSGVEKLVTLAGAVMSGLERPPSRVGPVAEDPP